MTLTTPTTITQTDIVKPQPMKAFHLAYLDGMRALAALYVLCVHAHDHLALRPGEAPWLIERFLGFIAYGHHAVSVFIVLSGFCLMLPVVNGNGTLRGGALEFYKRRAHRILPPYYITLAVCLLLIQTVIGAKTGTPWDHCVPVTTTGLLTHLFLVHDAFQNAQIDYTLWSVAVEWRIYFLFPLLVLLWRKIGPLNTTLLAIVTGYVLLALLRHTSIYTMTTGVSPEYLGLFAMGMFAAGIVFSTDRMSAYLRSRWNWYLLLVFLTIAVGVFSVVKVQHGALLNVSILDSIVGLWAMSLIVAAAPKQQNGLHRMLSWKPLTFIGTFAYSIYLIHPPLLQIMQIYVLRPLHLSPCLRFFAQYLVVVPTVVFLSYLFYCLFERPFLNKRKPAKV